MPDLLARTIKNPRISGTLTADGAITWSDSTDITQGHQFTKASVGGTAETLQTWRVSDDGQSFLRLANSSASNGTFAPMFWAAYAQSSGFAGLYFSAGGVDTTSSTPNMIFESYDLGGGTIENRPLMEVRNSSTGIFGAQSSGFYFFNPAGTFKYIVTPSAITADRTVNLPLLTENDEVTFEKYHNPIISPERGISGLAIPSVSTTAASLCSLDGALNGLTSTAGGTSTHTLDATEGFVTNFVSAATANVNCGLTTAATTNNITTANFNPVLRARFKIDSITASRVWIGFTGLPIVVSDTPMASATAGVIFGYIVSGGTFIIRSNDTSGAATTTTMTGIAPDTNWHTVTISLTGSQALVVLDDGAGEKTKTITTAADRPAGTDSLGVVCTGQTSTTAAKTFSLKFCSFRADK
jgi:hypothetical protein